MIKISLNTESYKLIDTIFAFMVDSLNTVNNKTPSDDKHFIINSIGCKKTSTLNETRKYRQHLPLMIQNLYH